VCDALRAKTRACTTAAALMCRSRSDDHVVDLDPDFQLEDPWVTREFRVFNLLAQRLGLPPYVNHGLGMLGF